MRKVGNELFRNAPYPLFAVWGTWAFVSVGLNITNNHLLINEFIQIQKVNQAELINDLFQYLTCFFRVTHLAKKKIPVKKRKKEEKKYNILMHIACIFLFSL